MKVEVNLEGTQVAGTIDEMFKAMTPEQKGELTKSITAEFFKGLYDIPAHRAAFLEEKFKEKKAKDEYSYRNITSVAELQKKEEYRFKELNDGYETPQVKLIREVTKDVIQGVKYQVTKDLETDETFKKIVVEVGAHIKENMAAWVHDSMVAYFMQHMSNMSQGISQALMKSNNADENMKRIANKLTGY